MIAARATSLAIRTACPAEADMSFDHLIQRVVLQLWTPYRTIGAAMPWKLWNVLMRAVGDVVAANAIGKMTVEFELSRSNTTMDEGGQAACGLRIGYTDHGHLVIEFLDSGGTTFAFAELTPDQFSAFMGQGCDLLEVVSKGGLATVECAGQA